MKLPVLTVSTPLEYPGYHGQLSRCFVQFWESQDRPTVVVVSELNDNPGTSVTNRIEVIAERITRAFELDRDTTIWFERYPGRPGGGFGSVERFRRVIFELDEAGRYRKPSWVTRTRANVEFLIGRPCWLGG